MTLSLSRSFLSTEKENLLDFVTYAVLLNIWILHYELVTTVSSVVDTPPSVSESRTLIQPNTEYRSCGTGQYLDITYGRYYCSNGSASVTNIMNTNCNYNSDCTILAQNSWLGGNPCVGITKTLEWTDACRGRSGRLNIINSCFSLIKSSIAVDFGIPCHRRHFPIFSFYNVWCGIAAYICILNLRNVLKNVCLSYFSF